MLVLVNSILSQLREKAHFVVSITHKQPVRCAMWIPASIYERLPQFWLLIGLLFITTGLYLGFEFVLSFYYIGLGALCCVYSLAIFMMRLTHRRGQPTADQSSEASE